MKIDKINYNTAIKKGFVIWEGNEDGIWYARSQNRNDNDYGKVYQVINHKK